MSLTAEPKLPSRLVAENHAAIAHFEAKLKEARDVQEIHRRGITEREGWIARSQAAPEQGFRGAAGLVKDLNLLWRIRPLQSAT